jgi:hypothetical protein
MTNYRKPKKTNTIMHPIKYMHSIQYNKDAGWGRKPNGLQPQGMPMGKLLA